MYKHRQRVAWSSQTGRSVIQRLSLFLTNRCEHLKCIYISRARIDRDPHKHSDKNCALLYLQHYAGSLFLTIDFCWTVLRQTSEPLALPFSLWGMYLGMALCLEYQFLVSGLDTITYILCAPCCCSLVLCVQAGVAGVLQYTPYQHKFPFLALLKMLECAFRAGLRIDLVRTAPSGFSGRPVPFFLQPTFV